MLAVMKRGFMMSGWRPGQRVLYLWGAARDVSGSGVFARRGHGWLDSELTLEAVEYSESQLARWSDLIDRWRPVLLYGYASALAELAHYLIDSKRRPRADLLGVYSTAEPPSATQREQIQQAFGCRVFNQYGCREVPNIAWECRDGGMHVFSDRVLLESVPGDGGDLVVLAESIDFTWRPREDGRPGSVVMVDGDSYEVAERQPWRRGGRWILEPWAGEDVMRVIFTLDEASVAGVAAAARASDTAARLRPWMIGLAPLLGFAAASWQRRWRDAWGFPAATATWTSAVLEMLVGAVGVFEFVASSAGGVSVFRSARSASRNPGTLLVKRAGRALWGSRVRQQVAQFGCLPQAGGRGRLQPSRKQGFPAEIGRPACTPASYFQEVVQQREIQRGPYRPLFTERHGPTVPCAVPDRRSRGRRRAGPARRRSRRRPA